MKSAWLYITICITWVLLTSLMLIQTIPLFISESNSILILILHIVNMLFISYFWLNGVKDTIYPFWYYFKSSLERTNELVQYESNDRILLVYCTYNDFNESALRSCLKQDYPEDLYEVYILDDSTNRHYKGRVTKFAKRHGLNVIRRDNNIGFKAGNINSFLSSMEEDNWKYFVLLDSDEIIPHDFIAKSLAYFYKDSAIGIVQANHIATRNVTHFQKKYAIGVDSHWPVYQQVKDKYGFMSLLGHGAMISRECYNAAGGFPHVVAEDLCFSINAREKGFLVKFAPDIVCEEEFPPDYSSFRKRHSKWTQGNMEFIKKYTTTIINGKFSWFEKMDIVLFSYSLPLTSFFSIFVVINVVILPLLNGTIEYPLWLLIPTLLFLIAPMLNDVIYHWRAMPKKKILSYTVASMLLYGSMYWTSLHASLKTIFGKSVFDVTPKDAELITRKSTLKYTWREVVFAVVLSVVSIAASGSILPVLLIIIPAVAAIYLVSYHQKA